MTSSKRKFTDQRQDDTAEPAAVTRICHPSEVAGISRRELIKTGASLTGYMAASQLFGSRAVAQSSSSAPKRRLVWINMSGGWDVLEVTDPKVGSTSGIDMVYGWDQAKALNGAASDVRIGRWLPRLAEIGQDMVVVRGLAMGTTSHEAGSIYMDTGVLSNAGRVNAASIPAIVASESVATIPIIQLSGGSEPMTDRGLLNPVSVVRAQNLDLYRSMYPQSDDDYQRKLMILEHLRGSVDRVEQQTGINDRLTAIRTAEEKIRAQFEDGVGSKLALTDDDRAGFTANAPQGMNGGQRDAFALALKLLKNNLVTCINLGLGGFDTHAGQETRLAPLLGNFDYLLRAFVDGLRAAGQLDNTLIVVYSDFGRTPKVNMSNGRDHWPVGGALLLGGGIAGSRAVGGTNDDLQAESVDATSGQLSASGIQLNPTHLGGAVLELTLGSDYLQYRTYLESIPALTRLKTS